MKLGYDAPPDDDWVCRLLQRMTARVRSWNEALARLGARIDAATERAKARRR